MERFVFHTDRLTGARALVLSWSIWFLCLLAMPVSPIFHGDFETVSLFVCSNIALWLGLSVSALRNQRPGMDNPAPRMHVNADIDTIMILLIVAGGLSLLARVIDYSFFRGVTLYDSFEIVRQKLKAAGPNVLSGIYAALSPAAFSGGILALALLRNGKRGIVLLLAIVLFSTSPIFNVLVGGRSTLFLIIGMALITLILVVPRFSPKSAIFIVVALLITFLITMFLFLSRVSTADLDFLARVTAAADLVPPRDGVLIAIRELPPLPRAAVFYFTSVGTYILHGVFEFFYLIRLKSADDPFLWGRYEFLIFDQARSIFFPRANLVNLEAYYPIGGVFSTFWGPAYVDFGYFMPIFGFVFGLVVEGFRKLVDRGDLFALPLYALLILQTFLVPIVNGLLMSTAIMLNVGFFALWAFSRLLAGRRSS